MYVALVNNFKTFVNSFKVVNQVKSFVYLLKRQTFAPADGRTKLFLHTVAQKMDNILVDCCVLRHFGRGHAAELEPHFLSSCDQKNAFAC